jgi:putative ABC transport system permease protein
MRFSPLVLAFRYLRFYPKKFWILTLCGTGTLLLPLLTYKVFHQVDHLLEERASRYPLIIGAKGSALGLVFHTLFYATEISHKIPYGVIERMERRLRENQVSGYAIPLLTGYRSEGTQIIGVSADFYEFAQLSFKEGHAPSFLGDVVLGAEVARGFKLSLGQSIHSDVQNLFNLASSFRSKLQVVGFLNATGGPEDYMIFCDIKTTWLLEGIYHGHQEKNTTIVSTSEIPNLQNTRDPNLLIGIPEFVEVTPENRDSFHAHGDPAQFPLTSVIVIPDSPKARAILRTFDLDKELQAVYPEKVMKELMEILLSVQQVLNLYFLLVLLSTLLLFSLVILLSLRLRTAEIQTMERMGCRPRMIFWILCGEYSLIAGSSLILALLLTALGSFFLNYWGYAYLL